MKLKILRGLPGSGKSTLAKQLVKDSGSSGRINRDDLRAMIFDSVWSGPLLLKLKKQSLKFLSRIS